MVSKRLLIDSSQLPLTADDFVWRQPAEGPSSFRVSIRPCLEDLGTVTSANKDAVWFAVTTFITDRTVKRPDSWERPLEIIVPSADPDAWNAISHEVEEMLTFLTSDDWKVTFVRHVLESRPARRKEPSDRVTPDLICLFSGGADSVCAAVKALAEGRQVTLMSHWDTNGHPGIQARLVDDLKRLFGVAIPHVSVMLGRKRRQPQGVSFQNEWTRRSRSLLFIALGLAAASAHDEIPLWVGENGFTSINVPLASERRGALSTRTTHPEFLRRLHRILGAAGAHNDFTSPYADMTKGEMFRSVAHIIGQDDASVLLSKTHSCSHARIAMKYHRDPMTHCGVCFGCMVRRSAFIASGLEDHSVYLITDLEGRQLNEFLSSKAGEDIETMRYAVGRDFQMADVLALNLPDGHDLDGALDLVRCGVRELALVNLP